MPEVVTPKAFTIAVSGAVQGVGFRPFVYKIAQKFNLVGSVENTPDGVTIFIQGNNQSIKSFLQALQSESPPLAHIQEIDVTPAVLNGQSTFSIVQSKTSGNKNALILPDMSICDDCITDITNEKNRRYQYPFTNCTNCGPRFSIIQDLPYDRDNTSMSKFKMCSECQQEYDNPNDRRFHAQPNACTQCGPQLSYWDKNGNNLRLKQDILIKVIDDIKTGKIIAIKGLGGFQIVCDARNSKAVNMLRIRKNRPAKPFALMVKDLEMVDEFCEVSYSEKKLLISPEKPIVILDSKKNPLLSNEIAPGNPTLGIMLPYTPLHYLLMDRLDFPIVATSGNIANEPICIDEHEAIERLGDIADGFLVHNRPIVRPVDDSVVRMMAGKRMILRRARGFAPLPIQNQKGNESILATGAHLKNTITVSNNNNYFISQHIGNLDSNLSAETQVQVTKDICNMYDLKLEAVACDFHPEYQSTRFAESLALPIYPVQHHLAHIWSVIGEHQIDLPILGIAWDGTGLGTDKTIWGSEFFQITKNSWKRLAHLKPFYLPGGDIASIEPRRSALGLLFTAFGEESLNVPQIKNAFSEEELTLICSQFKSNTNINKTTSMGRLFDAISFLTGFNQKSQFEGQAAMDLEFSINKHECADAYSIDLLSHDEHYEMDWQPMVLKILDDLKQGINRGEIASQFHDALVKTILNVVKFSGQNRICLSGGCFQNRSLLEMTIKELQKENYSVYWNQDVPINDGGISLGQAISFFKRRELPCV